MKRLALLGLLLLSLPGARPAAPQEAPFVVDDERVKAPKRVKLVRPQYPPEARAQGIRGIVILALTIDTEGKVSAVEVVRSIPGLDEAAIEAARQWQYEPPRVDGKPASVKVTVPITFALELPALTRQAGIPELRSGAAPAYPRGAEGQRGSAAAELTLDQDGRVAQAEILSGEPPWIEALLQAVRTWIFAPEAEPATVSFRVEAEFEPGGRGTTPRIALNLTGLRRSESMAVPAREPAPAQTPVPSAPETASPPSAETAGAPPAAEPPPSPAGPQPTTDARPEASPSVAPPPPAAPAPSAAPPTPAETTGPPPAATEPPKPEPGSTAPAQPTPAADAPTASAPRPSIATPPTEVLRGAPPAPAAAQPAPATPPGPGTSAVRDVTLDVGIPDLAAGRRPVVPPLARLQGMDGVVSVRFSIDGAGDTQVQAVEGPELLQAAARAMVASWRFQRASRERVFAVAEVLYRGDTASARVHRAD
jgi:TonB family protein